MQAVVSWNPTDPKRNITVGCDDPSPRNDGVAYLEIATVDPTGLSFNTWFTDTNGDYSANAVDIFSLPIDLSLAFPFSLHGHQVPSAHRPVCYVFCARPETPFGFNIFVLPLKPTPGVAPTHSKVSIGLA